MFLEHDIANGQGRQPTCFKPVASQEDGGEQGVCGAAIADSDMQGLLDQETFTKYQSLATSHAQPTSRICSKCSTTMAGDPGTNRMVCQCGHVYCFNHGDACQRSAKGDGGLPELAAFSSRCEEYEESPDYQKTMEALDQEREAGTVKPCPNCAALVTKNGGCNAMKCTSCSTGFCWICEAVIDNADGLPMHFSPWNVTSPCAGKQFAGMDDDTGLGGVGTGVAHLLNPESLNWVEKAISQLLGLVTVLLLLPVVVCIFVILLMEVVLLCFGVCFVECCVGSDNCDLDDGCQTRLILGPHCIIIGPLVLLLLVIWGPFLLYLVCRGALTELPEGALPDNQPAGDPEALDAALMQQARAESAWGQQGTPPSSDPVEVVVTDGQEAAAPRGATPTETTPLTGELKAHAA